MAALKRLLKRKARRDAAGLKADDFGHLDGNLDTFSTKFLIGSILGKKIWPPENNVIELL
uniref:Uncharacterized protein n=1 Tax=Romanomermis culicivorax TaxID=13658 RepID=A0A915KSK5_ROMCU